MTTGTSMTLNLRLAQVTLAMTCIICIIFPITSAYTLPNKEVPVFDDLNKRDVFMGYVLLCMHHPRNCKGGVAKPPEKPSGTSHKRGILLPGEAERVRSDRFRTAGDDFSRSLNRISDTFRRQLGDLLRQKVVLTDDTKEDW